MNGPYRELVQRWKDVGRRSLVRVREVACVNAARTLLCAEAGDTNLPSVTVAAGLHGDEPAGVWALLDLVRSGGLHPAFSYRLWPCVNPTGFDAGTRCSTAAVDVNRTFGRGGTSPEARAIVTSNRDRRFVLSLDLHEDCDARGFYCYEYGGAAIGRAAIDALDAAGLPIEDPHGFPERGRIVPDARAESALLGGLSFSLRMARGTAAHALTFESPANAAWETRLAIHRTAVVAALAAAAE